MQTIRPFLWFNDNAGEALEFYASIFKGSKIVSPMTGPDGKLTGGSFAFNGQEFMAASLGPHFKFNEAVSLFVSCETQAEVDYLWEGLSEGGEKSRCGWLKDKFGVSWQIIPNALGELMGDQDPVKAGRVVQAMLQMDKIDIQKLREAHQQG